MAVYFFQAGKADAQLIYTDDAAVLIDSGDKNYGDKIAEYLKKLETSLGSMSYKEVKDILAEIDSHFAAGIAKGKSEEELIKMIFALDSTEVKNADIVFMNIDGRVPDEGACVELGMAYGIGKRCYGFKTDTHSVELGLDMNPMISGCMLKIFKNYDGDRLIEEIRQYLSENAL